MFNYAAIATKASSNFNNWNIFHWIVRIEAPAQWRKDSWRRRKAKEVESNWKWAPRRFIKSTKAHQNEQHAGSGRASNQPQKSEFRRFQRLVFQVAQAFRPSFGSKSGWFLWFVWQFLMILAILKWAEGFVALKCRRIPFKLMILKIY